MLLCSLIVQVSVVLRKTVIGSGDLPPTVLLRTTLTRTIKTTLLNIYNADIRYFD